MSVDSDSEHPIILFDGVCELCNAWVQWVLKRDKAGVFHYAALQSEAGHRQLERMGLPQQASPDTMVLIAGGRAHVRSDAALEVLRRLGMPWSLFYVFSWIPRRVRHEVYDWVARNRYRWFGRKAECWLPRPEWKERFL